ncbi:MAG TPA: hypothetical protein VK670_16075, partial [Silvibacterium sp.]|nr:hypothetical protein [Silvibacterium sp.]
KIAGENSDLLQISPDERARVARSAVLFSEEDLTRFLQVMLRTFDELNYRQEQRFHLELGLVKLVHLERLLPVEDLLSRLPGAPAAKAAWGGALPPRSAPTQSRGSAGGAASTTSSAAGARGAASPGFSPFEADRNKRISGETASAGPVQAPAPRGLSPLEATARAVEAGAGKAPVAAVAETSQEATSGALALATEPAAAISEPEPGTGPNLDRLRDAVCSALEREGHNTASVLLHAGNWRESAGVIEVEVGIKKTMLGLTMNAEAEKICRETLRSIGETRKLVVIPGENGGSAQKVAAKAPAQGSIQAAALENPLVRQAQELFQAEVRSVLDLRDKKQ